MVKNRPDLAKNQGRLARLSKEELTELGRKGSQKAMENRRKRKLLCEIAFDMLNKDVSSREEIYKTLKENGFDTSYGDAMVFAMAMKAIAGDVEAARFVRDTSGQKPAEHVEVGNRGGLPFTIAETKDLSNEELRQMLAEAEEARSELDTEKEDEG